MFVEHVSSTLEKELVSQRESEKSVWFNPFQIYWKAFCQTTEGFFCSLTFRRQIASTLFLYLYVRKLKRKKSPFRFLIGTALVILLGTYFYQQWNNRSIEPGELNLPELPEGFTSYGIDISHHQGKVNWDKLFASSDSLITFIYCKATEGVNHVDSQWEHNRLKLLENGTRNGAYHFFLPQKDPITQAQHFLNHYTAQQGDLPPVLDAETEGESDVQLIQNMKTWLKKVETKTGMRPIIYTSHHFYRTKFAGKFSEYKFWIANYNKNVSGLEDEQIIHWQYSDHGGVPGIRGDVDMNFSKIEFE